MGCGQSCCFFVSCVGRDKAACEKVAIHLHPTGMCFGYFRPSVRLETPTRPPASPPTTTRVRRRLCLCALRKHGTGVNEVHPPLCPPRPFPNERDFINWLLPLYGRCACACTRVRAQGQGSHLMAVFENNASRSDSSRDRSSCWVKSPFCSSCRRL